MALLSFLSTVYVWTIVAKTTTEAAAVTTLIAAVVAKAAVAAVSRKRRPITSRFVFLYHYGRLFWLVVVRWCIVIVHDSDDESTTS